jgi:cytochrome c
MDSFELNKLAGAFLGAVFFLMSLGLASDALFAEHSVETPGFAIVAAEAPAEGEGGGEAAPAAELAPISPLLASADPAAGEVVFKKCASCHSWEEGGANKTGPNLWNIVNRPVAAHPDYKFSGALVEYAAKDGGKVWDYEALNRFLHGPKAYIPGTAMGFAGLKKDTDIANLIAWMRTHSPSPAPLP